MSFSALSARRALVLSAALVIGLIARGSASAQTTQVFSYTGANQTWVVPTGITSVQVKLWGAGGAHGGGSGAFVSGLLSVTAGQSLTLIVGQGGATNGGATFGGGGAGFSSGGAGGGRSGIRNSSNIELVTAAGGGGGIMAVLSVGPRV
jgi:hypothetical protein